MNNPHIIKSFVVMANQVDELKKMLGLCHFIESLRFSPQFAPILPGVLQFSSILSANVQLHVVGLVEDAARGCGWPVGGGRAPGGPAPPTSTRSALCQC